MHESATLPLRVLMTTDTVGGVWSYSLQLAMALSRNNVETVLATMGAEPSFEQRRAAAAVPGLSLETSNFKLEWMEDPWKDVDAAGSWLLELEEIYNPDLVHLNGYSHGCMAFKSPAVMVAHSCVLSWWESVHGEPAPAQWDEYRQRIAAGIHGASALVAPTRHMLEAAARHYGRHGRNLVIPNGREPALFPAASKRDFIFSAGRIWDKAKNMHAVEEAAAALPWPVFVAGETRHPEGGSTQFQALQPLGQLSECSLGRWLSQASIFVHPAAYEPFGLSVLEAGLAGCALVLGDIPTLRENWEGAALFVPTDDHNGLRETLERLIIDLPLRESMGACARTRALQFGEKRMAAAYLRLYGDLVRKRRIRELLDTTDDMEDCEQVDVQAAYIARNSAFASNFKPDRYSVRL